jgi:hypothetical protein
MERQVFGSTGCGRGAYGKHTLNKYNALQKAHKLTLTIRRLNSIVENVLVHEYLRQHIGYKMIAVAAPRRSVGLSFPFLSLHTCGRGKHVFKTQASSLLLGLLLERV